LDVRLVAIGVSLLALSTGFLIYALSTNMQVVAGASLSVAVLGGVIATLGFTYRDPLSTAMLQYSRSLSQVLLKLYEDLELLSGEVLQTCRVEDGVLVVYAQRAVPCSEVKPGIGLAEQTPYIAFHVKESVAEPSDPQHVVRELGLADTVLVQSSSSEVYVELVRVRRELLGGEWRPFNPVQLLVAAYLTLALGSNLVRLSEEFSGGLYRVRFRVVSS